MLYIGTSYCMLSWHSAVRVFLSRFDSQTQLWSEGVFFSLRCLGRFSNFLRV